MHYVENYGQFASFQIHMYVIVYVQFSQYALYVIALSSSRGM